MIIIDYKNYNLKLKAWTLGDIKRYLLNRTGDLSFSDSINEVCEYIAPELNSKIELTAYDKLYILLDMRSKIVGEDVENLQFVCPHCNNPTEGFYNIMDSIQYKRAPILTFKTENYNIKFYNNEADSFDNYISINDNTDKDYISKILDEELTVKEMDDLIEFQNNNEMGHFYFEASVQCILCGGISSLVEKDLSKLIDLLINTDLVNIYKLELSLKKEGFLLQEIHGMMPFEKSLYINLINEGRNNE